MKANVCFLQFQCKHSIEKNVYHVNTTLIIIFSHASNIRIRTNCSFHLFIYFEYLFIPEENCFDPRKCINFKWAIPNFFGLIYWFWILSLACHHLPCLLRLVKSWVWDIIRLTFQEQCEVNIAGQMKVMPLCRERERERKKEVNDIWFS